MKIRRPETFAIIAFALSLSTPSFAQTTKTQETCDEKIPQVEGKDGGWRATSNYIKSQDETFAKVFFRIVGNGWCVDEKEPDVIRGRMGFHSKGNKLIQPETVWLTIDSVSTNRAKHPDGETLTILTDGKALLSRAMKLTDDWTTGWTMKHFELDRISYSDFLKMVQAKKVIFQIGETKAELQAKELQSIRDLNNLIQKPDATDSSVK